MKTKARITSGVMGSMFGVFAHLQGGQDAAGHCCEGLTQEERTGRRRAGSKQQLRGWRVGAPGCPQAAGVPDLRALFSLPWPVRPLSLSAATPPAPSVETPDWAGHCPPGTRSVTVLVHL